MIEVDTTRDLEARNRAQAELIKELWADNAAKARRIARQQGMIDYLRNWKKRHEQSNTPKARAEALFEKG